MQEPYWMGYVGMLTGIIGAITGVAGAIMGFVSYRTSNNLKSLDLRLDLRKAINNLQSTLSQLDQQIEDAIRSREAVAAATGRFHSGAMQKWKQDTEIDKTTIKRLLQSAPATTNNYDDLTPKDLESTLVEVHRLQVQVDGLSKKYYLAVQSDDEERKHLREDVRTRLPQ
ncbi:MAG TPA: hypothetical protein VFL15_06795 [Gammaproteobacteria bacterium]|nr:hypothetical protein [Gammaproteobacteria bacterium]